MSMELLLDIGFGISTRRAQHKKDPDRVCGGSRLCQTAKIECATRDGIVTSAKVPVLGIVEKFPGPACYCCVLYNDLERERLCVGRAGSLGEKSSYGALDNSVVQLSPETSESIFIKWRFPTAHVRVKVANLLGKVLCFTALDLHAVETTGSTVFGKRRQ